MNTLRFMLKRLLETAGADGAAAGGGGEGSESAAAAEQQAAAAEQRARSMGWSPKEQWRGDPQGWLDANEFIRRGEQVLPLLQANSRKDRAELEALRKQVAAQNASLVAATESIQVLTNLSTEQGRQTAKEKRRELLRQQAEARTAGNADLEIDLGEQIADMTAQINATPKEAPAAKGGKKPAGAAPADDDGGGEQNPVNDPAYQAFTRDNPWFGTDGRRTALATAIGRELRSDPANDSLQGKPFFDKVVAEVNKIFAPARPSNNKVEGSTNGGGNHRDTSVDPASGKSYADLPQDAKDACDRDVKRIVGEGRAFKDVASWRKHYVSMYFNS